MVFHANTIYGSSGKMSNKLSFGKEFVFLAEGIAYKAGGREAILGFLFYILLMSALLKLFDSSTLLLRNILLNVVTASI